MFDVGVANKQCREPRACCPGSGTINMFVSLAVETTQRILLKMKVEMVRKLLMNQMLRRKRRRKKITKLLD